MLMTITKLKAKNQVTIPIEIVKKLHLRQDEFLGIDIEDNYIKLIPVDIEPRWTKKELKKIDRIVKKEKGKSKMLKPGKRFSKYIKKISK